MFFESAKLKQLKICYLFMHADGVVSELETKYLDLLISKLNLTEGEMQEFHIFCQQMASKLPALNAYAVIDKIDEVLWGRRSSGLSLQSGDISKTMQVQTIWTLINLGYADTQYSEAEKKVVRYLIDRWKIDPLLASELHDTAETIVALTKQKSWVQAAAKPPETIRDILQELDRNIAAMYANVETMIAESDII